MVLRDEKTEFSREGIRQLRYSEGVKRYADTRRDNQD